MGTFQLFYKGALALFDITDVKTGCFEGPPDYLGEKQSDSKNTAVSWVGLLI